MRDELLTVVYWKAENGPPVPLVHDKIEAVKKAVKLDLAAFECRDSERHSQKPVDAIAQIPAQRMRAASHAPIGFGI